jgi:voltage-gated potassium channel
MNRLHAATDTLKELALAYAALLLVFTFLFMAIEGHNFADSLYWAGTTATSTGYGDISPKSTAGEMLALALMHLSIFGVAPLIVVRLIERLNQDRDAFTHEEQMQIVATLARIEQAVARLEAGRMERGSTPSSDEEPVS